jgi:hypothetical protein
MVEIFEEWIKRHVGALCARSETRHLHTWELCRSSPCVDMAAEKEFTSQRDESIFGDLSIKLAAGIMLGRPSKLDTKAG